MKIKVGTLNTVKIEALKEMLADYPHLSHAQVEGVATALIHLEQN